ncbi:FbpB family small basic protein [Virgibacillus sp. MSJ-26]|nr:FbpB family small basic protein [Virgibacillus sp. MSJ-26]
MSLKRKPSFEELVRENREQILQDKQRLAEIDQNIEVRMEKIIRESKKNA